MTVNNPASAAGCDGPLIWFPVDAEDSSAVLECAAQGCDYIIATGSFHDAAHANAGILREGLA